MTSNQVLNNHDQVTRKQLSNNTRRQPQVPILEISPSENEYATLQYLKALCYFKDTCDKHVLAQVWVPVKNKGRYVLSTSDQPYLLDSSCNGLLQYREVSRMYSFPLDGETDEVLELPGRVFRHKLPEWTPNVQYYSDKEYQRLNHALNFDVRGAIALPVFEPSGQSCVGVIELILTSQKINYASEVDKLCKALEAVNLKSSNILDLPNKQICNKSRQQALAEILEVIVEVCETHNLPLAQTWVPCRHKSVLAYGGGFKKSCSSFDGSCMGQVCMSTTDVAFYVVDADMWGFRDACAEHHKKGQGVAGRAFATRSSCFCENITLFGKTEYPLVHYARLFGLVGSFAICLRSSHTGDDDYIVEFFLPPNMVGCKDQQTMLGSLLTSMKQHFRSLNIASGQEIGEDGSFHVEIIRSRNIDSSGIILIRGPNEINENCGKSEAVEAINKSERKQGKTEKSISFEVLQQHFAGSLKDAAKNLGVSLTAIRRICRQHGISRWPSCKINQEAGQNSFHAKELIPYTMINGLKHVKNKIEEALKIICGSHNLSLAQVWIAYGDEKNVPSASSLEDPEIKQMLALKLTGYLNTVRPGPSSWNLGEYYNLCDIGSPETGELALQTLQDYESRYVSKFCPDYLESQDMLLDLASEDLEISALMICLRSNDTGDFDYAFEFIWPKHSNYVILLEALVFTLKRCLPGFKFALGAELGDELDVFVVESSTDTEDDETSETKKFKIFQGKKSLTMPKAPEERKKPMASDYISPSKEKCKTATILLPRKLIEKQFGKTMKEAAKSLNVSLSTLKRKCNALGISEWRGPNSLKKKANDPYIIQTDTNEEDSGAIQDSSVMNKNSLSIKVEYGDDMLKFRLPILQATFITVEKEIGMRLKLSVGTYKLKYLDEDGDWISLISDEGMDDCIKVSRKLDRMTVRLRVMPFTQPVSETSGFST
ncbi:hypothetical protein QVD17_39845 [Tagetes erecta]|uniref:NIN-like protein n=1 Tax=Tagetes erecta TaxID=13708 RepID=A0AAD8NAH2_TARER|nr:hypothetical protein QVD17_39845 [Tagetes erecta]